MFNSIRKKLFILFISIGLVSCGDGGSSPSSLSGNSNPRSASGNVVDGPLQNAKVYLDTNGNSEHDTDEPFALTDENGNYTLTAEEADLAKYKMLVEMTDKTIDTETGKSLGAYTLTYFSPSVRTALSGSLNSQEFSINAFTSLIQDEIEKGVAPNNAVANVGLLLGLKAKYYRLLLVDFWKVKKDGKIYGQTASAEELKIINKLHNIARVYVRVLSSKLKDINKNENYTKQQKGYITHLLLNALKLKLSEIQSTDNLTSQADLLAKELKSSINVDNIKAHVTAHNFNKIKPNKPIVDVGEMYSVVDATAGININWFIFYGENATAVTLVKLPEGTITTKALSADTPNKQGGSFTIIKTKPSIYAYKICLKNSNGENCSKDFNVRVIKQSNQMSKTLGTADELPAKYPLLASGERKLRPGKAKWNGWMQGVKSSKFIKKAVWYNAAWSKWGGLIADEYTFIRCYDKKSFDAATTGYQCDKITHVNNFITTATDTWDHWLDGKIVGKAGGQTAKVALQGAVFDNGNLYKVEDGVETGVFYVHQVKLCRTVNSAKHCSVSDPLKIYVTAADGSFSITKPGTGDGKIPHPNDGGNDDNNKEEEDATPPGQEKDNLAVSNDKTKNQTPLAVPNIGYIANSWGVFGTSTSLEVKLNKYYGSVGTHWKIEMYKYGLDDEIDKSTLTASRLITPSKTGDTGENAVPDSTSYAATFTFTSEGMYVFKGYLCNGDPGTVAGNGDAYCKATSNVNVIQVGGTKKAPKVKTPPTVSVTGDRKEYKSLTDEEYVRLEQEKRSPKLKEAIERIMTLPVSKHEIVNGKDLGPNLSLTFANVNRVNSIYKAKFDDLEAAQTNGKIDDFETSVFSALTDFEKAELAWQWLFPMANGHIKKFPTQYNADLAGGKYPYTYTNFLKAIAKYPKFCGDHAAFDGDNADDLCKLSMAMMFAHFAQEVGGHLGTHTADYKLPFAAIPAVPAGKAGSGGTMKVFECKVIPGQTTEWCRGFDNKISMVGKDIPEYRQALYWVNESGCSEGSAGCDYRSCTVGTWQAEAWPCPDTTKYFGRGPKQLSYNYNYGPFSHIIFGDVNVLLKNPGKVTEGWLAFASAVYFFMQPRPPKPSMYELVYGHWTPNTKAAADGLGRDMGTSIVIINGGVECGGSTGIAQADNRVKYYSGFLDYFGMMSKINLANRKDGKYNCKGAKQFGSAHGANYLNSWAKDWTKVCKLVAWETAYSGFNDGAYKQCFEREILGR